MYDRSDLNDTSFSLLYPCRVSRVAGGQRAEETRGKPRPIAKERLARGDGKYGVNMGKIQPGPFHWTSVHPKIKIRPSSDPRF